MEPREAWLLPQRAGATPSREYPSSRGARPFMPGLAILASHGTSRRRIVSNRQADSCQLATCQGGGGLAAVGPRLCPRGCRQRQRRTARRPDPEPRASRILYNWDRCNGDLLLKSPLLAGERGQGPIAGGRMVHECEFGVGWGDWRSKPSDPAPGVRRRRRRR